VTGVEESPNEATLRARIDPGAVAFWWTLGVTIERVDAPGHVVLTLPWRKELETRRPGVMHGGAIASLIDSAAGAAVLTLRDEHDRTWAGIATLDMNVSYLNPAMTEAIAEATVLRASRTLVFVQVDVRDREGTPIAAGRCTYSIARK